MRLRPGFARAARQLGKVWFGEPPPDARWRWRFEPVAGIGAFLFSSLFLVIWAAACVGALAIVLLGWRLEPRA